MGTRNPFEVGDRVAANRAIYYHFFPRCVIPGDKATVTRIDRKGTHVMLEWDFTEGEHGCFVSDINLLTGQRIGHDSMMMLDDESL